MDAERERIQADLRGLLAGEVRCDDVFVQLYASDASLYEIRPLGVVRPRNTADVVACVKYAAEKNIPIHARGAGTGIAGESLGPGLVLDFSHSMRRILSVDGNTVRIQPGVVHAQLNKLLATSGRMFGPDPATSTVTTMGSVLALDNSGSHWLRHGSPRSHVVSMQVVLADGSVVEAGRHPIEESPADAVQDAPNASGSSRSFAARASLVRRLAELIQREQTTIAAHQPKSLVNRSGYHLNDVLADGQLDLAKLLVGSEGTLALITEATLKVDRIAKHTGVVLLFFDRLEAAARAAIEARSLGVSACDLMDRRLLGIARETDARYAAIIPPEAEAMLLVEIQSDDPREVRDAVQQVVVELQRKRQLAFDTRVALEPDEIELYWRLANQVVPRLYSLKAATRAIPFVEDFAVPPDSLPDFIGRMQNVLKTHQVTATLFGHAGHGQLHVRPFLDLANADDVRRMQDLAADLYQEVLNVGGTISGEHGDGLSRTWFVKKQYGPLYDVFREVKRIFDPKNIFNPGKVVADAPQPLTKNLRPQGTSASPGVTGSTGIQNSVANSAATLASTASSSASSSSPASDSPDAPTNGKPQGKTPLPLFLIWKNEDVTQATNSCNGCGQCRTQMAETRMCPIFRFAPREEASPRSKANLMRAILAGQMDQSQASNDAIKDVADLCVNCHQCRLECPANVNIPKLMIEAKAQYIATHGLRFSDAFVTRLDRIIPWASLFASVTNWALGNRPLRWLLQRFVGLAQGRKVPHLAMRSFLRQAHRRRLTRPPRGSGRKVFFFVDLYANWFDVQLAEAVVSVLEHNGVSVYVHPDQRASGMSRISHGDVDRAKVVAEHNVRLLAEAVRQGFHIVASEPTAALCLTHEYPNLLDDDDTRLVAANTSDVCTYLWKLHQTGKLELDFAPINATLGYHLPCHLKALNVGSPGEELLRLVPGLTVQRIERGCSGMAGTFGLKRDNYRTSLRAGWGLISALRDPAIEVGATECSACKIQMEQGTTKPTIHPLKVLALAYGLMPEIADLLTKRGEELIVT